MKIRSDKDGHARITEYESEDYNYGGPVVPKGYEELWRRATKGEYPRPTNGTPEQSGDGTGSAQINGYGHSGTLVERVEQVVFGGAPTLEPMGTDVHGGHDPQVVQVPPNPTGVGEATVPFEGDKGQTSGGRTSLGASFHQVQLAIVEAEVKHGKLTTNYERVILLMTEELGEIAECVATKTRADGNPNKRPITYGEIIGEIAQLGSLCVLFIENLILEEEEKKNQCQLSLFK